MGLIEQLQEQARLIRVGKLDDWYVDNYPYVLELSASGPAVGQLGDGKSPSLPNVYFTLPIGPQEYTIKMVYRQSKTPTMGGIVAEENGWLWSEIHLRGTFGLEVKPGEDTTLDPDPAVGDVLIGGAGLSGPGWTRRMFRNIFEKYATLKANPDYGAFVQLIWHDLKLDRHYVVVPSDAAIVRSVQKRMQYPYEINLTAIADAENRVNLEGESSLKGFFGETNAIGQVKKGLELVNAGIQETSAFLGEIRTEIQTIDTTLGTLNTIVVSANALVDGTTETLSVGRTFVSTAAATLQSTIDLIEDSSNIGEHVRQNYQMALDGLHIIAAQAAADENSYDNQIDSIQTAEGGAASDTSETLSEATTAGPAPTMELAEQQRVRSSDEKLVEVGAIGRSRLRGIYSSFVEYAIKGSDTLASIAANRLGDGSLWYDLAIINGLQPPYISLARAPGTVGPGDVIVIPQVASARTTGVAKASPDRTSESLLGTNIALVEDANSQPGRPVVDWAIDQRTMKDVKKIAGVPNLAQALQMRTWTLRGTMPLIPSYGRAPAVGVKNTAASLSLIRLSLLETIRADSRVKKIRAFRFEIDEDLVDISIDVQPIGSDNVKSVKLSVV